MNAKLNTAPARVFKVAAWADLREKCDLLLKELGDRSFMERVLEGAFQVAESDNPIRGNLCAAALREIAGHVLHALAPDGKVSNCCWYQKEPNTNGPTRQQRATYIVQGGLPMDFVTETLQLDHKAVCRPLIKAMEKLNRVTHVREGTILHDDTQVRTLVRDALDGLLGLFEAARICQKEVHQELTDEIHDAIFDTFLSETLQELDELSTHTTFETHELEDIEVIQIDDESVHLVATGTVYVELQYGSNSDVRNDMGTVMSDSYPYTALITTKVQQPKNIIRDNVQVSVNNSSFYE